MDQIEYHLMRQLQDHHWWFTARRRIIEAFICQRVLPHLPANPDILEIGCGMGGNLSMLSKYGTLDAADTEDSCLEYARSIGCARSIFYLNLPDTAPLLDRKYNCIIMLDVLEHISEDIGALEKIKQHLHPGGILILTVPALPCLWSVHDIQAHHFRRYTKTSLCSTFKKAGWHYDYITYFNTLLFPAIGLARLIEKVRSKLPRSQETYQLKLPTKSVNIILDRIFSLERYILTYARMPVGVSLLALAHADQSTLQ